MKVFQWANLNQRFNALFMLDRDIKGGGIMMYIGEDIPAKKVFM